MTITIVHKHFFENNCEQENLLTAIENKLNFIIQQNTKIMAKQEQFDALIQRLNLTTNDIASDLKLLKDQIAAGTVSDESLAKLDADITKLEALGASTDNPVPEPPVDPLP